MVEFRSLGVAVAALILVACGEAKPGGPGGLDPRDCVGRWQVLYSPPQILDGGPPSHPKLRWQSGRVFFPGTEEAIVRHPLLSLPADGGEATTVLPDFGLDYWIEDDRVLYVELGSGVLYQVKLSGLESERVPEPLVDSHVFENGSSVSVALTWALDSAALYWAGMGRLGASQASVWRASRDASDTRMLASIDLANTNGSIARLLPIADQLLTATGGLSARLWKVPTGGGEAQELPRFDKKLAMIIGISEDGTILWSDDEAGTQEMGRSRHDGLPVQPFETSVPSNVRVSGAWSDGSGGYYLAATEKAADDAMHVTVWRVNANGDGRRLACDPQIGSSIQGAVAGPDGLYGTVLYSNSYWELVRIRSGSP